MGAALSNVIAQIKGHRGGGGGGKGKNRKKTFYLFGGGKNFSLKRTIGPF